MDNQKEVRDKNMMGDGVPFNVTVNTNDLSQMIIVMTQLIHDSSSQIIENNNITSVDKHLKFIQYI